MRCVVIGPLHGPVAWYGIMPERMLLGELDWYEFLCFGSPTVKLASQYNYLIPYHVTRSCKGPVLATFSVGFFHLGFSVKCLSGVNNK